MSYILELKNNFSKYEIIVGETEELDYDRSLFDKYNILMEKIYRNKNKFNSHVKHAILNISQYYTIHKNIVKYKDKLDYRNIILDRLNIKNEHFILIKSYDNIENFSIYDINKKKIKNKKVETITTKFNKNFYKYDKNGREMLLNKTILIILYNLNNILEEGGNLTLRFSGFKSNKTFFLLILLLSYFKYGYIMLGVNLYLIGYKQNVNPLQIKNIFNNNINFKFNIKLQSKIQYIINYILFTYKNRMERTIYEILDDNINLNKINNIITINNLLELGLYDKLDIFNFEYIIYNLIKNNNDVLITIVNIFNNYIKKYNIKNILEIGSSEGIIPLYLLNKNKNIYITSLYTKNIKYNTIKNILNENKNYNIIINKKNNLINKSIIKNNKLILFYLLKDNNYNIKLFNQINNNITKNTIIAIDFAKNNNFNIFYNFIKNTYKILYKSLSYFIIQKE